MAPPLRLRLYLAGDALHSSRALANLREALRVHAPGRHELEVVNVMRHPERALEDGVLLTPTLLLLAPAPLTQIVGDLRDTATLLRALGIEAS